MNRLMNHKADAVCTFSSFLKIRPKNISLFFHMYFGGRLIFNLVSTVWSIINNILLSAELARNTNTKFKNNICIFVNGTTCTDNRTNSSKIKNFFRKTFGKKGM